MQDRERITETSILRKIKQIDLKQLTVLAQRVSKVCKVLLVALKVPIATEEAMGRGAGGFGVPYEIFL